MIVERDETSSQVAGPLRVLLAFNTPVLKHGSFEDYMIEMGREICLHGGTVTYVFPRIRTERIHKKLKEIGKVYIISNTWPGLKFITGMRKIVAVEKPNLINVHFCKKLGYLPLYLWLRARGTAIVFHYHGETRPLSEVGWIRRNISELRCATFPVNRVVTVSKSNALFLQCTRIRPPIKVIYNGIDLQRFSPSTIEDKQADVSRLFPFVRYIVYIGTMLARKRIDFLINAFAQVCEKVDDVGLIIVGGGEGEVRYKEIVEQMSLRERVVFKGLLPEYPYELLKNAALLVSASKQESFGLVFAEASALGVPVVACRVGGIPEVVMDGKTGFLAEPDDLDDFVEKIIELLTNEDRRRQFSANARQWVAERFDLTPKVVETVKTFRETLSLPT